MAGPESLPVYPLKSKNPKQPTTEFLGNLYSPG
jgi:hypothetical protein